MDSVTSVPRLFRQCFHRADAAVGAISFFCFTRKGPRPRAIFRGGSVDSVLGDGLLALARFPIASRDGLDEHRAALFTGTDVGGKVREDTFSDHRSHAKIGSTAPPLPHGPRACGCPPTALSAVRRSTRRVANARRVRPRPDPAPPEFEANVRSSRPCLWMCSTCPPSTSLGSLVAPPRPIEVVEPP